MLTPFTERGEADDNGPAALIDFCEEDADGLFAIGQSSEIFWLSLEERVNIAAFVKRRAHIPVITCGHVSCAPEAQAEELCRVAETGRFRFMKDTCCDIAIIRERFKALESTSLQLYNANTSTLLDSLRVGAAGIMAIFHPELYARLLAHPEDNRADVLQTALTQFSLIERQLYPVNAKYHLQRMSLPVTLRSRAQDCRLLTPTFMDEVRQLERMTDYLKNKLLAGEKL